MQAIILAAGRGTRMRPLSDTLPKPMLPLGEKPITAHVADAAVEAGAEELVFTIGYRGEIIEEYFGKTYRGIPVNYAKQESRDGTADAVAAAIDYVDGPFAVLNGDNVYDAPSLSKLFDRVPSIGTTRVESPEEYGVVSLNGDRVTGIVEKPDDPPTNRANTGAYTFPAWAKDHLDVPASERGERELTDVLARLIDRNGVTAVKIDRWADVGYPWDLLEVTEQYLDRINRDVAGDVHADATLSGAVVVEPGASIDAGVVVDGPVLVRRDATVGPNAIIRGNTVIGEGVTVGQGAQVENSILMSGATVEHLSSVCDSILGEDATLGAGTVVANNPNDGQTILAGDAQESTNRRRFGAVVGPRATTGVHTSLNPGTILATKAETTTGAVVGGRESTQDNEQRQS